MVLSMSETIIEKAEDASPDLPDGPFKVVVFGTQPKQVRQMVGQLTRKKIMVRAVTDEKVLIRHMSEFDPDLILLELNGPVKSPIEDIVMIRKIVAKTGICLLSPPNSAIIRVWRRS